MHRSLRSPQQSFLPGDLFPHDVEDGGADEAVLYGAGKQEGGATLQQLVQRLTVKIGNTQIVHKQIPLLLDAQYHHLLCVQLHMAECVVDDDEVLVPGDHGIVPPVIGQFIICHDLIGQFMICDDLIGQFIICRNLIGQFILLVTHHSSPMCCLAW